MLWGTGGSLAELARWVRQDGKTLPANSIHTCHSSFTSLTTYNNSESGNTTSTSDTWDRQS
jgi:hypothetical protein